MSTGDAVVVGGNGAVGKLLCEMLARDDRSVVSVDLPGASPTHAGDPPEQAAAAERQGSQSRIRTEVGNILDPSAKLADILAGAELVVLAVPEHVALGTPLSLFDGVPLLVETLSVKSGFASAVRASSRRDAVLGINPMFAPALGFDGRPVACVTHRPGTSAEDFVARITAWGGRIVDVDPDTHDRVAAATQALTHASVLAFGSALAALEVDAALVDAVAPPPARTMLALLARIAGGEPEVYWDVQAGNPYARAARVALVEAATRIDAAVAPGTDTDFADAVARAGAAVPDSRSYLSLCADLFGIVREPAREENR